MEVAAGTADAAVLDLTLANAMIGEGTDYASLKIVDELNAEGGTAWHSARAVMLPPLWMRPLMH